MLTFLLHGPLSVPTNSRCTRAFHARRRKKLRLRSLWRKPLGQKLSCFFWMSSVSSSCLLPFCSGRRCFDYFFALVTLLFVHSNGSFLFSLSFWKFYEHFLFLIVRFNKQKEWFLRNKSFNLWLCYLNIRLFLKICLIFLPDGVWICCFLFEWRN